MNNPATHSLREILQYAYALRASIGPTEKVANEKDIKALGGQVKFPKLRRKQINEALKVRFPESYYYAVETGVVPQIGDHTKGIERS
ncbi:MAG: hypothetical protein UT39_C0002G0095 [Candidatus Woesebacteria bacterium GW2011_GWA1_39_21]|uniref:Uncharacterized protein n=1 Tax=Candidatus Woesebacteria bacterium GW2011_GWA1_39_21 TaxID=1618550 RepID=A0A0G0N6U3_9BACT|nr:MAG: hypothetical protein UT39_C0002G0095 [Candidatus Woesebacteria bacterium GW2011_GWA1_39_21]